MEGTSESCSFLRKEQTIQYYNFFINNAEFNQQWNFLRDAESKSGVNLDLTPFIQGDLPLFCQNDRSGVLGVCKSDKIFLYFNGAVRFSSIIALCFMFICNIKVFQCVRETFIVCGCESRLCPIAHTWLGVINHPNSVNIYIQIFSFNIWKTMQVNAIPTVRQQKPGTGWHSGQGWTNHTNRMLLCKWHSPQAKL